MGSVPFHSTVPLPGVVPTPSSTSALCLHPLHIPTAQLGRSQSHHGAGCVGSVTSHSTMPALTTVPALRTVPASRPHPVPGPCPPPCPPSAQCLHPAPCPCPALCQHLSSTIPAPSTVPAGGGGCVMHSLGSCPRGQPHKHTLSCDTNRVQKILLPWDPLACSHQDAPGCNRVGLL